MLTQWKAYLNTCTLSYNGDGGGVESRRSGSHRNLLEGSAWTWILSFSFLQLPLRWGRISLYRTVARASLLSPSLQVVSLAVCAALVSQASCDMPAPSFPIAFQWLQDKFHPSHPAIQVPYRMAPPDLPGPPLLSNGSTSYPTIAMEFLHFVSRIIDPSVYPLSEIHRLLLNGGKPYHVLWLLSWKNSPHPPKIYMGLSLCALCFIWVPLVPLSSFPFSSFIVCFFCKSRKDLISLRYCCLLHPVSKHIVIWFYSLVPHTMYLPPRYTWVGKESRSPGVYCISTVCRAWAHLDTFKFTHKFLCVLCHTFQWANLSSEGVNDFLKDSVMPDMVSKKGKNNCGMELIRPGFTDVVRFEPEPDLSGRMQEHCEREQHHKDFRRHVAMWSFMASRDCTRFPLRTKYSS